MDNPIFLIKLARYELLPAALAIGDAIPSLRAGESRADELVLALIQADLAETNEEVERAMQITNRRALNIIELIDEDDVKPEIQNCSGNTLTLEVPGQVEVSYSVIGGEAEIQIQFLVPDFHLMAIWLLTNLLKRVGNKYGFAKFLALVASEYAKKDGTLSNVPEVWTNIHIKKKGKK